MEVSEDKIDKFRELYEEKYGIELSKDEAAEKAANLARLMKAVYRPMKKEEHKKVQERREETEKIVSKLQDN
jgi:hypothetical protein